MSISIKANEQPYNRLKKSANQISDHTQIVQKIEKLYESSPDACFSGIVSGLTGEVSLFTVDQNHAILRLYLNVIVAVLIITQAYQVGCLFNLDQSVVPSLLIQILLCSIGTSGLLMSQAFYYINFIGFSNELISYSASLIVLSLSSCKNGVSCSTFMLIMSTSLIIIGKLRTNAVTNLFFIISASVANYQMKANLIDLALQVLIFLHSNISYKQNHSTNKAFHHIILNLREEILNNTNYVAGVVHDLRNPLTEIYSCAELLGQNMPQNQLTPDIAQIILAFKRNSENLISMVNNILDYAKIKAKKLELDLQPTNIRDFLTKIVDMHQVRAQQKGIKLSLIFEDDSLPEKLYIDQSRLTNILVNLASNAIKFTQQGGVSIFAHWFPDRVQTDPLVTDEDILQKRDIHFAQLNQELQDHSSQQLENRQSKESKFSNSVKPKEEKKKEQVAIKPKDSSKTISEIQQIKRPTLQQLKQQPCEASFGRDMFEAVKANIQHESKLKPSQFNKKGSPNNANDVNEEFGTPALAKQTEDNDSMYSSVPRLKLQDIKDTISDNNIGSSSPVKNGRDVFQFLSNHGLTKGEERKSAQNQQFKSSTSNRLLNSSNDESPSIIKPGGAKIGTINTSLMLETNLQIGEEGDNIEAVKEFLPIINALENGSFDKNKSGAIQSQLYQGHMLQSTQFRTNRVLPPHSLEQSTNEIKIKICSLEEDEQEKGSSSSSAAMIRVGYQGQQQKDVSPFQRNSPDLTVSMLGSQFSGAFGLNRPASGINTRTFGSTNQQFATTFSKEVAIEKTVCNIQHSHFQRNNGLAVLSQNVAHASTFTLNNVHTSPERATIKGQTITNSNILTIQGLQEACEVESYHKKEIVFTLAPEPHSNDQFTTQNFGFPPAQKLSENAVRPIFRMFDGSDYNQDTPKLEPEQDEEDEEEKEEIIVVEEESKVIESANKLQSIGQFTPIGAAILAQNSGLSGFPISSNIEKKLIKGQTISCSRNDDSTQFAKFSDQNPSTSKLESQNVFSNLTSVELKKNTFRNSNRIITKPQIAQAKQTADINQQASSGTLILQVADTGIGIPSEFKKKLFQPFGQAHKGIQKSFGGTGLGLWISKMIVELMGGQINLESEENLGSRFIIKLQMKVAKPEPTIHSSQGQIMNTLTFLSQASNSHFSNTLQSRNLLVLSDSFSIKLLQGYAEPLKLSVKQITQTSSLIQLILEQGKKCIFFDEEYSHQIIKYVRKFKKQNQIILVALKQQINQVTKTTNTSQRSGISQILKEAEIDYVMRKPLQKSEFNQILSKVLLRIQLNQEHISHSMNEIPRLAHHDSTSFIIDNQGPRSAYGFIGDNFCDTRFVNQNSQSKQEESAQNLAMQSPAHIQQNSLPFQARFQQTLNQTNNNTQPISPYNARMTPQSRAGIASPFRGGFQNEIMGAQFTNSIRQSQIQLLNQQTQKLSKLLIVDDSDFLLKIMAQLVDKIKVSALLTFEVILAANGEEAFKCYEQYQKEIKLILMDIQMPVMDGYQSASKIREFEEYNAIQPLVNIVALSGDSTPEHMKKCRQIQINETVQKPICRDKLEQLLKNSFSCVI